MTMKRVVLFLCLLLLVSPAHAKKNKQDADRPLPSGLQKKVERGKGLPPGWQKKVAKGRILEESIYIHLEVPPPAVLRLLPPPPPGVSLMQIENKIVKLREKDRLVVDVFDIGKLPPPPPLPVKR